MVSTQVKCVAIEDVSDSVRAYFEPHIDSGETADPPAPPATLALTLTPEQAAEFVIDHPYRLTLAPDLAPAPSAPAAPPSTPAEPTTPAQ